MARTSAGRRMRLTVPPHHAVHRHLGNLNEEADLNAELLRLAELGATLEELCGPMRSVADIVKLLNFRAGPALFAPAAGVPTLAHQPAASSPPDAMTHAVVQPAPSMAAAMPATSHPRPNEATLQPVGGEPQGSIAVDASLAEHMWFPD